MNAQERIKQQVTGHPVVLYMKGTPQFPQCGFSANAVQILKACGVEQIFTVNVLEEQEIRRCRSTDRRAEATPTGRVRQAVAAAPPRAALLFSKVPFQDRFFSPAR